MHTGQQATPQATWHYLIATGYVVSNGTTTKNYGLAEIPTAMVAGEGMVDKIHHGYDERWSCPLTPADLRPDQGGGASGGEGV